MEDTLKIIGLTESQIQTVALSATKTAVQLLIEATNKGLTTADEAADLYELFEEESDEHSEEYALDNLRQCLEQKEQT